jgi:hypothetical protein
MIPPEEIIDVLRKSGYSEGEIIKYKEEWERMDQIVQKYRSSKVCLFEELIPKFKKCLDEATIEEDIQVFLKENPALALEAFSDGSAPLDVIPKFKLGQDLVTDFTVLGVRSFGKPYHVIFVELESPTDEPFTKVGVYSKHLNLAIKQINDWDIWLKNKFETFCADFPEKLPNYKSPNLRDDLRGAFMTYKIVIGRRSDYTDDNRNARSSIFHSTNGRIEIMSFDKILDVAENFVKYEKPLLETEY